MPLKIAVPLCLGLGSVVWGETLAEITIDPSRVIKDVRHGPLGLQVESLPPANPKAAAATVRALGARHLRYGNQRDYFWAAPPFERALPVVAVQGRIFPASDVNLVEADGIRMKPDRVLDFDEFAAIATLAGARPLLITTYNSAYLPKSHAYVVPSKETYFRTMEEWVRYANVTRKLGVRFVEIGNEVWNIHESGAQLSATEVAKDVKTIAPRLKKIDPDVQILVSGDRHAWFRTLFTAASHIDFVTFSFYLWNFDQGYESFRTKPSLLHESKTFMELQRAMDELSPADRNRIGIIVTEFNALDWAAMPSASKSGKKAGWPNVNDLGHALCVFQMAGEALSHPKIHLACYWSTQYRWLGSTDAADDTSVFNAIRNDRTLTPTGLAISLWGQHLLDEFVYADSEDAGIRVWATRSADLRRLNLFVLNKEKAQRTVRIKGLIDGMKLRSVQQLTGASPECVDAKLSVLPAAQWPRINDDTTFDALSATILEFAVAHP